MLQKQRPNRNRFAEACEHPILKRSMHWTVLKVLMSRARLRREGRGGTRFLSGRHEYPPQTKKHVKRGIQGRGRWCVVVSASSHVFSHRLCPRDPPSFLKSLIFSLWSLVHSLGLPGLAFLITACLIRFLMSTC